MAFSIGGVGATARNLTSSTRRLADLFDQISAGSRLAGKSSNDPAGGALYANLMADATVSRVARDNAGYGQLVSKVAENTLQSAGSDITMRLRELAVQSSNGTLSDSDRRALDLEARELRSEQRRQFAGAEFNGTSPYGSKTYQVGNDSSGDSQITSAASDPASIVAPDIDLSTQESATLAIDQLAAEGERASQLLGESGAFSSRLEFAAAAAESRELTAREAADRIGSLDFADAMARLTQERGLQQFAAMSKQGALRASGEVINRLLKA
jgi:flagellin